jgi:hypothetical protein
MRITIAYDSSWRNSFLDGSNNEPLPKGGRGFVGSMTALKTEGNFIERTVTRDTVMGVLNRLIGEQRKLYQARLAPDYWLADVELALTDADIVDRVDKRVSNSEVAFIRNITGSTDQNAFTGMIKSTDPWLTSEFSKTFWDVLWLSEDELFNFILAGICYDDKVYSLDPLSILAKFKLVEEMKFSASDKLFQAKEYLSQKYPQFSPTEAKGVFGARPFYCSALYLQLDRLSEKFDTTPIRAARGGLTGISHNGFTYKNLMERFTTGNQKRIWGNPYMLKKRVKGEGETVSLLTKASGVLEINLNIDRARAEQIKQQIENAGVSSFYLGKKGLAYVSDIRT